MSSVRVCAMKSDGEQGVLRSKKSFLGYLPWCVFILSFWLCLSPAQAITLTATTKTPKVNDEITVTSDTDVTWSVTTGANTLDFTDPVTTVNSLKTTMLRKGSYTFTATVSGNSASVTIDVSSPSLGITFKSLVQENQGILPSSQLTEIAEISFSLSNLSDPPTGANSLTFGDLYVEAGANVQGIYLFALEHKLTHTGSEKFLLANIDNQSGDNLVLMDFVNNLPGVPGGGNVVLSGAGSGINLGVNHAALEVVTGARASAIFNSTSGNGFAQKYFVAVTAASTLIPGTSVSVKFTEPTVANTRLTDFQSYKGSTESTKLSKTLTWDKSLEDITLPCVMNFYNLVNPQNPSVVGNTNAWPGQAVEDLRDDDIQPWLDSRFAPDWSTVSPSLRASGPISNTGYPLLGAAVATPVYALQVLGGTADNPAKLDGLIFHSLTTDWFLRSAGTNIHGANAFLRRQEAGIDTPKYDGFTLYRDNGDGLFHEDQDTIVSNTSINRQVVERTAAAQGNISTLSAGLTVGNTASTAYSGSFAGSTTSPLTLGVYSTASGTSSIGAEIILGSNTNTGGLGAAISPNVASESTFFVVLKGEVNVDDGDAYANPSNRLSPVGSSFQIYPADVFVSNQNLYSGNGLAQGQGAVLQEVALAPLNDSNRKYVPRVATLYNLANVGPLADPEIFPFDDTYGYEVDKARTVLHNFTPEAIFGVDLVGTDDATVKSAQTETVNGVTNNYMYRFSGLRVMVSGNSGLSNIPRLTNDMLSGLSLWKDSTTRKGYWDGPVDLVIDEDGVTTTYAGLSDYSQLKTYAGVGSVLSSFKATDRVFFEDVDGSNEYTLGESLFVDINETNQWESSAEQNQIIYNQQQLSYTNSSYMGFSGGSAISASETNLLKYSDRDGSGTYSTGDVIVWDHDMDAAFDAPSEYWVRPIVKGWESRTTSTATVVTATNVGTSTSCVLTAGIAASVWDTNHFVGATVEFATGNLFKVTANSGNTLTLTTFQPSDYTSTTVGGTETSLVGQTFWILQTDLVADVGQEVYDYNFSGNLSTTDPRYWMDYRGYDYFVAARGIHENISKSNVKNGSKITLTAKASGLLLDPINGFVATHPVTVDVNISAPATYQQVFPAGQEIGVFSNTSDPIALMGIDLVSGNVVSSSSSNGVDRLDSVVAEIYNRGGFAYQSDLAPMVLSDNVNVGAFSGLSLWEDRNTYSGTLKAAIESVSTSLTSDSVTWADSRFDPNGQKIFYITVGTEEIGYKDLALINGTYHFLGLIRGAGSTSPQAHAVGATIVAGRNGKFEENVDRNVTLSSSPYSASGAGHATMLKFDVDTTDANNQIWIPVDNTGNNAGAEVFICARTTPNISNGDTFALGLVQWNKTVTGPENTTFRNTNFAGTAVFTTSSATASANNNFGHGKTEDLVVDSTAPSSVSALVGTRGANVLSFNWTKSSDSDAVGSMIVRRNGTSVLQPANAVSYFPDSFLKTHAVFDGVSGTASANVLTGLKNGIVPANQALSNLAVGDFVIIRSGQNAGRYVVDGFTLDGTTGITSLGLNRNLAVTDSSFSLELGNGLVLKADADTNFSDSGLTNGVSYTYDVFAYDNVYNYSGAESVTMMPAPATLAAPNAPSNPAVQTSSGTLRLFWTNSDSVDANQVIVSLGSGFSPVDGQTYIKDQLVGSDKILYVDSVTSSSSSTLDIFPLSNGTKYNFQIFAFDKYKNYSSALSLSGTPSGDLVAPGEVISAKESNASGTTTITWTPPSTTDVAGYVVLKASSTSALQVTGLLTDGLTYTLDKALTTGSNPVTVAGVLTGASSNTFSSNTTSPKSFYKIHAHDGRPNYSALGAFPDYEAPEITITDLSSALSGNTEIELAVTDKKTISIAQFGVSVAKDDVTGSSFKVDLVAPQSGTHLSSRLESIDIIELTSSGNLSLLSQPQAWSDGTLTASVTIPTGSDNVKFASGLTRNFRVDVTVTGKAVAGDNFIASLVTFGGTGDVSNVSVSSNVAFVNPVINNIAFGGLIAAQGNMVSDVLLNASANMLEYNLQSKALDTITLKEVNFSTLQNGSPVNLFASSTNVYRNGEMLSDFHLSNVGTNAGNLRFTSTANLLAGANLNFTLSATPSGNQADKFKTSLANVIYESPTEPTTVYVPQTVVSDEFILLGDGLNFDFKDLGTVSREPNVTGPSVVSDITITNGSASTSSMSQLVWTAANSSGFDYATQIADSGANLYLCYDRDSDGHWNLATDNVISQLTIAAGNVVDSKSGSISITYNVDTAQQSLFNFSASGAGSHVHRYLLVTEPVATVAGGEQISYTYKSSTSTATSKSGETGATTAVMKFTAGTMTLSSTASTLSSLVHSKSTDIEVMTLKMSAANEDLKLSKMTFVDLNGSANIASVRVTLTNSYGSVSADGVASSGNIDFTDFSGVSNFLVSTATALDTTVKLSFNVNGTTNLTGETFEIMLKDVVYTGSTSKQTGELLNQNLLATPVNLKAMYLSSVAHSSAYVEKAVIGLAPKVDLITMTLGVSEAVSDDAIELESISLAANVIGGGNNEPISSVASNLMFSLIKSGTTTNLLASLGNVTAPTTVETVIPLSNSVSLDAAGSYTLVVSANLLDLSASSANHHFHPVLTSLRVKTAKSLTSSENLSGNVQAGNIMFKDLALTVTQPADKTGAYSVYEGKESVVHVAEVSADQGLDSSISLTPVLNDVWYYFWDASGREFYDISANVERLKLVWSVDGVDKELYNAAVTPGQNELIVSAQDLEMGLLKKGTLSLSFTMKSPQDFYSGKVELDYVEADITYANIRTYNVFDWPIKGLTSTQGLSFLSLSYINADKVSALGTSEVNLVSGNTFALSVSGNGTAPNWSMSDGLNSGNVRLEVASDNLTANLVVDRLMHTGSVNVTVKANNAREGSEEIAVKTFDILGAVPLTISNSGNVEFKQTGGFQGPLASDNLVWQLTKLLDGGSVLVGANVETGLLMGNTTLNHTVNLKHPKNISGVYALEVYYEPYSPYYTALSRAVEYINIIGSPPTPKVTRPTANTLKVSFSDIRTTSVFTYYFLYANVDGVWTKEPVKIVKRADLVASKGRQAASTPESVSSYSVDLDNTDLPFEVTNSSKIYFKVVGASGNDPKLVGLQTTESYAEVAAVTPPEDLTPIGLSDEDSIVVPIGSGGGGGGCLLRD